MGSEMCIRDRSFSSGKFSPNEIFYETYLLTEVKKTLIVIASYISELVLVNRGCYLTPRK